MSLIRKKNESIKDYKLRLMRNKDEYDLTYSQIADLINNATGDNYSESAYRKWYKNYKEGFEDGCLKPKEDLQFDLLNEKLEIKKERYKLQAEKNEINRKLRQYSRKELLYENISKEISQINFFKYSFNTHNHNDQNSKSEEESYILGISDIHYGISFETNSNSYSKDICYNRFSRLLEETINKIQKYSINQLNILNLGDTLQGMIHINDASMAESSVVKSTVEISHIISQFLIELSKYCLIKYYHVPMANHTQLRPLKTKANELAAEDLEYIVLNYIYDMTKNNSNIFVKNKLNDDYVSFFIAGKKCVALHGHQIKKIESALMDLSLKHDEFYDYVFLGHFHNSQCHTVGTKDKYNKKIFVNPSFVGTDPFSCKIMKSSNPEACLYKFDKNYGHIGTELIILK